MSFRGLLKRSTSSQAGSSRGDSPDRTLEPLKKKQRVEQQTLEQFLQTHKPNLKEVLAILKPTTEEVIESIKPDLDIKQVVGVLKPTAEEVFESIKPDLDVKEVLAILKPAAEEVFEAMIDRDIDIEQAIAILKPKPRDVIKALKPKINIEEVLEIVRPPPKDFLEAVKADISIQDVVNIIKPTAKNVLEAIKGTVTLQDIADVIRPADGDVTGATGVDINMRDVAAAPELSLKDVFSLLESAIQTTVNKATAEHRHRNQELRRQLGAAQRAALDARWAENRNLQAAKVLVGRLKRHNELLLASDHHIRLAERQALTYNGVDWVLAEGEKEYQWMYNDELLDGISDESLRAILSKVEKEDRVPKDLERD